MVDGPLRDRFRFSVLRILNTVGVDKLAICPAPDCGRLFVRVTRKEYCSTRCQSRLYMRKYRAGEAGG